MVLKALNCKIISFIFHFEFKSFSLIELASLKTYTSLLVLLQDVKPLKKIQDSQTSLLLLLHGKYQYKFAGQTMADNCTFLPKAKIILRFAKKLHYITEFLCSIQSRTTKQAASLKSHQKMHLPKNRESYAFFVCLRVSFHQYIIFGCLFSPSFS